MRLRRMMTLLVVALAAGGSPVSAGGWGTVELTKPVTAAVAGEPVVFEFQVLQHGVPERAIKGDIPNLTATHAESGAKIETTATEGKPGFYAATITFDQAGRWKLRAASTVFPASASFPTLYVTDSVASGTPTASIPVVATETIEIVGASFVPNLLEVEAGAVVSFINRDSIKQEVAFVDAAIDDSGIMDPGAGFVVTFAEPGEYHLACGPHPGMSATIVVT